jgi:glycerol-3-phosphate dehydrogenase (NAD(P)+)
VTDRVVILGAGVMGSAMTLPAVHGGCQVDLVGTHLDEEIVLSIQESGLHPRLGVALPDEVRPRRWTEFPQAVLASPDLLILGVSSAGVGWAIDRIVETAVEPLPILMLTKGLTARGDHIGILPDMVAREVERRTGMRMPVMAVGGPCIAGELAVERETSVVVTGADPELLARVLGMLETPYYHARASADVIGVEICAAFKNFFTLAVGAPAGQLERQGRGANGAMMHNHSASLFTQALREMTVLATHHGGVAETVMGLAGAGDLYVTCQAGRNGRMGRLLGLGMPYSVAKKEHMSADTVEGAQLALDLGPTLRRMAAEGRLDRVRLPLTFAIVDAICDDAPLELNYDLFHRSAE